MKCGIIEHQKIQSTTLHKNGTQPILHQPQATSYRLVISVLSDCWQKVEKIALTLQSLKYKKKRGIISFENYQNFRIWTNNGLESDSGISAGTRILCGTPLIKVCHVRCERGFSSVHRRYHLSSECHSGACWNNVSVHLYKKLSIVEKKSGRGIMNMMGNVQ